MEVQAGTLTFTFASGVDAFGAYFSGVQFFDPNESITFSDGTSETISIPETNTSGSVGALDFVGFTDAGKSITSITINAGNAQIGADYIGVDDVQFTTVPTVTGVPEPSSIALALSASLSLALVLVRRQRAQNN